MTLSDSTGNNSTVPTQGNSGNNSSKFKSQLRADAQEFKPTFGITGSNVIPNSGIYYHGMMPNYSHVIEYDGYRVGGTYYNKSLKKQNNGELSKSSTYLNPNAQEFIPRGWVNPTNEPFINHLEHQKFVKPVCADTYTQNLDQADSQRNDDLLNLKSEQIKHNSADSAKPKMESSSPPQNVTKMTNKADNSRDISLKSQKKALDSDMDLSPQKVDQGFSSPASNKLSSSDLSNQSTHFTFKDKLLARVSTNNNNNNNNNNSNNNNNNNNNNNDNDSDNDNDNDSGNNINVNNIVSNAINNQSTINSTEKQNSEIIKNVAFAKTSEIQISNKEAKDLDNSERHDTKNEIFDEKSRHSNQNITTKTNLNVLGRKETDTGPVSWAQRLKNSTSIPHNKKTGECCTANVESTFSSENKPHTEINVEKYDTLKSNSPKNSTNQTGGSSKDNSDSNKTKDSKKSREKFNSLENSRSSKREASKKSDLDEKQKVKKPESSICEHIESETLNSDNNSSSIESKANLNEDKEIVAFDCPKEEKTATKKNSLFEYKNFPIYTLLALRTISSEFKNLDTSFSPPELFKRNFGSKELDRDGGHRGRGWSGNLSHSTGNKHYHRETGNYGPNNRRDRFQSHGNTQNSQGSKRVNDNANGGAQNSTLDWTRDERKMFRLESSAESWVVKQKEQKAKGNQFETRLRQYRAILNKLTIEKFDKLYEQILSVGINNEEEMIGLLKLVFDKATTQHHFIPMYVELCDKLRDHLKDVTTIETRRILVDLCQELFVENLSEMVLPEHIQDNEEDSFEWQLKYKNKMKGNMIFMASLVRKKVIASTVVLMCMEELLQFHLPHHLEALCVFLHHVGPFLDSERWKHYEDFNTLFLQFEEFSTNKEVPIRIRFLINDVIDSRKNNWKSKNAKEGPMMLDDLKSKINAERGESGGSSAKVSNSSQYKSQNGSSFKASDKNAATDNNVKSAAASSNPWQKHATSSSSKGGPVGSNNSAKTSEKNKTYSQSNHDANIDKNGYGQEIDDELLDEENEYYIPEHIKDSIGGLMDSYVASYDLDEFFGHINDLEIPQEYFDGVYKSIFIRIAEYKVKQRSALFKALILYSLKNKEYMNGESAKSGIQMALQPSILDDILIDVPQFKEIVLTEFITDAISKYDSNGQVFDSDFISKANLLLS
ncbi:Ataxin-2 C-terminal/MIF4G domain containing protein [Cryptosporidium hominis]|uniref:Ataxin-2 C-terminal/MIF4G domain containing protein n=1 Tax=Cryptosporidium hominis TaxID=237895 RepID=A0ABX5BHY0_CRYHO|nr:Ataxin-2 C-terminal/MIF4G domain containing protein [Cryptosporidium hominis]|eukprot:PPS97641.1 Ataxin-2 C-terminal/MIF4G domain containing protein [Cryptosporidium hominis]